MFPWLDTKLLGDENFCVLFFIFRSVIRAVSSSGRNEIPVSIIDTSSVAGVWETMICENIETIKLSDDTIWYIVGKYIRAECSGRCDDGQGSESTVLHNRNLQSKWQMKK